MVLPRLIVIADRFTDPEVATRTRLSAEAGAPWIMLRDRVASGSLFVNAAAALVEALRALSPSPSLSVTAQVPVAHALQINLHLGKNDMAVDEARRVLPSTALIGYSAHTVAEVEEQSSAADYLFMSPVFTSSHRPGVDPLGLATLTAAVAAAGETPVYALGGIAPGQAAACRGAGAYGVAVVSGVFSAEDVAGAVRAYLDRLQQ